MVYIGKNLEIRVAKSVIYVPVHIKFVANFTSVPDLSPTSCPSLLFTIRDWNRQHVNTVTTVRKYLVQLRLTHTRLATVKYVQAISTGILQTATKNVICEKATVSASYY